MLSRKFEVKYFRSFVVYFQIKIYGDVRERRLRSFERNVGKMAKDTVNILSVADKVKFFI